MALDPSIWLDSVGAVPTFGIKTFPTLEPAVSLLGKVKPVLQRWQSQHGLVKIGLDDTWTLKLERPDGLQIALSHDNFYVKFVYVTDIEDRGGLGPPIVTTKTPPTPYLTLCGVVREAIRELAQELNKDGNRQIERIGIVAEGNLDPEGLPPGFEAYLKHLASPWGEGLAELNGTLLARLAEDAEHLDRCHHAVIKISDKPSVLPFKLDWQRTYLKSPSPNPNRLMENVDIAKMAALTYFGRFGMGDLQYAADR